VYGWIWHKLPGNRALKALESVVLIALVASVLVVLVFPWVEPKLPFSGNTVSGETDSGDSTTTPAPSATTSPSTTSTAVPTPSDTDSGDDVIPGD
jgi:hypothetical protein